MGELSWRRPNISLYSHPAKRQPPGARGLLLSSLIAREAFDGLIREIPRGAARVVSSPTWPGPREGGGQTWCRRAMGIFRKLSHCLGAPPLLVRAGALLAEPRLPGCAWAVAGRESREAGGEAEVKAGGLCRSRSVALWMKNVTFGLGPYTRSHLAPGIAASLVPPRLPRPPLAPCFQSRMNAPGSGCGQ